MYHWIMQFESFRWLSPASWYMNHFTILCKYGKQTSDFWGVFIFYFLYFGGVFNKTIIPFALVGYEIGYSHVGYLPSHIQCALKY